MNITSKLKSLSTAQRKSITALAKSVRELDQEQPGHYVAFVDEGKYSRDVKIVIDPGTGDIISNSCDCEETVNYCNHQLAVLVVLQEDIRPTSKVRIAKAKVSPYEAKLTDVNQSELITWLAEQMSKNKALEISYLARFEPTAIIDIKALRAEHKGVIKSVLGRRRSASPGEIGQIIKALHPLHEQILEAILPKIYQKESMLQYANLIELIEQFYVLPKRSTTRIETYLRKTREKVTAWISQMPAMHIDELLASLVDEEVLDKMEVLQVMTIADSLRGTIDAERFQEFYFSLLQLPHILQRRSGIGYNDLLTSIPPTEFTREILAQFPAFDYSSPYNVILLSTYASLDLWEELLVRSDEMLTLLVRYGKGDIFKHKLLALERLERHQEHGELLIEIFKDDPTLLLFNSIMANPQISKTSKQEAILQVKALRLNRNHASYNNTIALKFRLWYEEKNHVEVLKNIKTLNAALISTQLQDWLLECCPVDYFTILNKLLKSQPLSNVRLKFVILDLIPRLSPTAIDKIISLDFYESKISSKLYETKSNYQNQ